MNVAERERLRERVLEEVVAALGAGYHAQNPSRVHPADYITKRFKLDGHENLDIRIIEPGGDLDR